MDTDRFSALTFLLSGYGPAILNVGFVRLMDWVRTPVRGAVRVVAAIIFLFCFWREGE